MAVPGRKQGQHRLLKNNFFSLQSSVRDGRTANAVTLENKIVLRQIFHCLPLRDLKQCRLVTRSWNSEAVTFIRDFRRCGARISKECPCSDLLNLADVVWRLDVVPINSLSIELSTSGHSECKSLTENQRNMYAHLLQALHLQNLQISWHTAFSPLSCPAVNFVIDLLRKKIEDLSTLELTRLPQEFLTHFGRVWAPWLPKLTLLDIGNTWAGGSPTDFILTILDGAPHLKSLKGDCMNPQILEIIPEAKYALLKEFFFYIYGDVDERNCQKLAAAIPALTDLLLNSLFDSDRQYRYNRNFLHISERLLSSSCETLETFGMDSPIFPLSLLTFPPMINVKTINIDSEDTSPHLLHVLRDTDYPRLFPALLEVTIQVSVESNPNDSERNPWENKEAAQLVQVKPSTTVTNLEISAEFEYIIVLVVELSEIFPNARNLKMHDEFGQPSNVAACAALYRDLWASWPNLESVSIKKHRGALRWNFDAEFLGISTEEAEFLKQFDDESLEKMNIVPVRPSVLTLSRKITKLSWFPFTFAQL